MNINSALLEEGLFIMAIGMGVVFSFLVVMIFSMHLSEKILKLIGKYFPEEKREETPQKKKQINEEEEIAVAIAAVLSKTGI